MLYTIVLFDYSLFFFFFFFFSSRRRHTRCYRDWSSDVCSSDLGAARRARAAGIREDERCGRDPRRRADHPPVDVRPDLPLRRARIAAPRAAPSRQGDDGVAEEEAGGSARRPPPERLGEDDRVRVFGAPEAGRAGLDAPPLAGADRGRQAARF